MQIIAESFRDPADWEFGYAAVLLDSNNAYGIIRINFDSQCREEPDFNEEGGWLTNYGYNPPFDWVGTKEELLDMAKDLRDPFMPSRTSSPNDYMYKQLVILYNKILLKLDHKEPPHATPRPPYLPCP